MAPTRPGGWLRHAWRGPWTGLGMEGEKDLSVKSYSPLAFCLTNRTTQSQRTKNKTKTKHACTRTTKYFAEIPFSVFCLGSCCWCFFWLSCFMYPLSHYMQTNRVTTCPNTPLLQPQEEFLLTNTCLCFKYGVQRTSIYWKPYIGIQKWLTCLDRRWKNLYIRHMLIWSATHSLTHTRTKKAGFRRAGRIWNVF